MLVLLASPLSSSFRKINICWDQKEKCHEQKQGKVCWKWFTELTDTCDFKMKKHLQNLTGEDDGLTFWLCLEPESLELLGITKWIT